MGPCIQDTNNIKNRLLAVLFILFPGLSLSATTDPDPDLAGERWFQVELIIFAHNNREALESEDWPRITGLTLPENLVELAFPAPQETIQENSVSAQTGATPIFEPVSPPVNAGPDRENGGSPAKPVPMPVAFEMLPEEELQLKEALKKLTRSPQFDPLLHVAWRQPTYEKDQAQTVLLYDGMTERVEEIEKESPETGNGQSTEKNSQMQTIDTQIPQMLLAPASEEDTRIGPPNPRVVGTVSLSVSRYLHLAAELVYRTPVIQREAVQLSDLELWYDRPYPTLAQHQGPAYQLEQWYEIDGFKLEESRRMRSKKIHYLDHPFFGVVVLITPVELPTNPEQGTPDSLQHIPSPDS